MTENTKDEDLKPLETGELKYDQKGLIPAVIQDHKTGAVLMVGYMNEESLKRTLADKKVCFWSRSRQEYWVKGETSGNIFEMESIRADCDADALLLKVTARGPGVACHTGRYSCFFNNINSSHGQES